MEYFLSVRNFKRPKKQPIIKDNKNNKDNKNKGITTNNNKKTTDWKKQFY